MQKKKKSLAHRFINLFDLCQMPSNSKTLFVGRETCMVCRSINAVHWSINQACHLACHMQKPRSLNHWLAKYAYAVNSFRGIGGVGGGYKQGRCQGHIFRGRLKIPTEEDFLFQLRLRCYTFAHYEYLVRRESRSFYKGGGFHEKKTMRLDEIIGRREMGGGVWGLSYKRTI